MKPSLLILPLIILAGAASFGGTVAIIPLTDSALTHLLGTRDLSVSVTPASQPLPPPEYVCIDTAAAELPEFIPRDSPVSQRSLGIGAIALVAGCMVLVLLSTLFSASK